MKKKNYVLLDNINLVNKNNYYLNKVPNFNLSFIIFALLINNKRKKTTSTANKQLEILDK